jgi:hypothetical protein
MSRPLNDRFSPFVIATLCLLLNPAANAVNRTQVFQQGSGGYTGVRDTWVSTADWDTPKQYTVNYGRNAELLLSRDGSDNPLLRFDLGTIPANSEVIAATLSLYNITDAGCDRPGTLKRTVELFGVLRDWDEGNQVKSPIDASGKHGATGDFAFSWFKNEGQSVPWAGRGLVTRQDYAAQRESAVAVGNTGWDNWDIRSLVHRHLRSEQKNFGVVLRDATGYQDNNCDWRSFVSSQSATTATTQRPKLTVTYNPDVPFAQAGPDQENLGWKGTAVTLDGSGSHDRPGGNDATLLYAWRIAKAAYGSKLGGTVIGNTKLASFKPDVAGEWEIELQVTNSISESATDRVHIRVLSIPARHPRLFLTPSKLQQLKARARSDNPRWTHVQEAAGDTDNLQAMALVARVASQDALCTTAAQRTLAMIADPNEWSTKGGDVALIYDWCHTSLTLRQRQTFIAWMNAWGTRSHSEDSPNWGNYRPRYGYSLALIGLATYGENPQATQWLDEFRHQRFAEQELPQLNMIADGGGWPEGTVYDGIANLPRIQALEAWRSATGENLFLSTSWFRNRAGYLLLHHRPGLADQYGYAFHPYNSTGDAERNRGSMMNYERIMALILIERFPDLDLYRQLQSYLAAPPADGSMSFLAADEFLWFNPSQPSAAPRLLAHDAKGLGTVFLRSDWRDAAADTDPAATSVTFQAGDHFSYHQHYDQNSFTLFKHDDLMVDSGVYSGEGTSYHDINYYVRTIAHNTLIVYNPDEDFGSARPDAQSNDGGQRTFYPASRSPETVDYWKEHAVHYDTGDILRRAEGTRFSYVLGDARKAYNNPSYHQTIDTSLSGNVAKVNRFQREFIYLRPEIGVTNPKDYVAIFDRVGVTKTAFSGANTKLLFHTLGQPTVTDGTGKSVSPGETLYSGASQAHAVSGKGKLFMRILLPLQKNIRKVGRRGFKSFWVFDGNYDWHWDAGEPQPRPINDFEDVPYGEWRLELEPADTAIYHNFLTVLYPTASTTAAMPATTLVGTDTTMQGAHIADTQLNRLVLFSTTQTASAPTGAMTYRYTPTARTFHLLVDLKPGTVYALKTSVSGGARSVTLTPDGRGTLTVDSQGVLQFVLSK